MPTLTRRLRRFPVNVDVSTEVYVLQNGSSLSLSAPPALPAENDCVDNFLFWNVLGTVYQTPNVAIGDVGSQDFSATAWYLRSCPGGGGGAGVSTAAFSIPQNAVLADSPIASVNPSSAWGGGNNTFVDTAGAEVAVTAKDEIGSEDFSSWMVFGQGTPSGATLTVGQGQSALAIANYAVPERWIPDVDFGDLELYDIFDKLRGKLGDWVSDPSPIDLLRAAARRAAVREGVERGPDDLSRLTKGIEGLSRVDLESRLAAVTSQMTRLQEASKLIESALKNTK